MHNTFIRCLYHINADLIKIVCILSLVSWNIFYIIYFSNLLTKLFGPVAFCGSVSENELFSLASIQGF